MGFLFIALTIFLTVYSQIAIKWQMNQAGEFPPETVEKIVFLLKQFLSLWIISGFMAAFLSGVSWMAAMTQFELSFAYPFTSLSYVLVVVLSILLFDEVLTWNKLVGVGVILLGLFILTR